jgi:hypothetical protein
MIRYITLLFIILTCKLSLAQMEGYIWTFGDSAAIDFNSGSPVPILGTGLYAHECSSTICDSDGNLLFYSGANSITGYWETGIFNKFNKLIQNGTGIFNNSSSAQGCILVASPQDTNEIYLITHRADASINDLKIYYTIIDKSANTDSGAVILKNVPLPGVHNFMAEQMQVVRHGNGKDWWLITHVFNNNQFYIYLIDSAGISGPSVQNIGSSFIGIAGVGNMKISPDGNRLVLVGGNSVVDLFDIDRCTGLLYNFSPLGTPSIMQSVYAGSFSPNSTVLYVSDLDSIIYQFDLQATDIMASRQTIWVKPASNNSLMLQHMLGPDGKIYISNQKNGVIPIFNFENMHLSVINSPDSLGAACDFQPYSFYLGGRRSFGGLPNIPDYSLLAVEGGCVVSVEEVGNSKNDFVLFPNPASDELNIAVKSSHELILLKVFNVFGKEVLSSAFINQIDIDVSSFPVGIYLVKLFNEKNEFVYSEKIIMQK